MSCELISNQNKHDVFGRRVKSHADGRISFVEQWPYLTPHYCLALRRIGQAPWHGMHSHTILPLFAWNHAGRRCTEMCRRSLCCLPLRRTNHLLARLFYCVPVGIPTTPTLPLAFTSSENAYRVRRRKRRKSDDKLRQSWRPSVNVLSKTPIFPRILVTLFMLWKQALNLARPCPSSPLASSPPPTLKIKRTEREPVSIGTFLWYGDRDRQLIHYLCDKWKLFNVKWKENYRVWSNNQLSVHTIFFLKFKEQVSPLAWHTVQC
jgi:hypothetical protein